MKLKNTMILAGAMLSAQFATGADVLVTSDITKNTTWTKSNVYILDKSIFVKNGATLTIQPGTLILGTEGTGTRGSLIITRNGTIDAVGTKDEPIVFTAKEERDGATPLDPAAGDGGFWGGLIILGNAPINFHTGPTTNASENEIEGFPAGSTLDIRYGGRDATDSSGRLKYVSIRFGGYEFTTGKEINGLTLGGVGRGTEIDSVEIISNTDDGLEIFGGTVNTKRIAVAFCQDDSFDLDEGHRGSHQFWFALQNADGGIGDRGGEWDGGNGVVKTGYPYTDTRIFNATFIGDGAASGDANHGFHLDDNFAGQLHNSVVHDFSGTMVDLSSDAIGATPDPLFQNVTFGTFGGGEGSVDTVSGSGVAKGVNPQLGGISRSPNGQLNPIPTSSSPLRDSSALSARPSNGHFEAAPYRGAFGDKNWLDGWSYLSQMGYLPAPVDPLPPVFTKEPVSKVITLGNSVTLYSAATADGRVTYQWFRNGEAIDGATSKSYQILKVNPTTAGNYRVDATLEGEFTTRSAVAAIKVATLTAPNSVGPRVGRAFTLNVKNNFEANTFSSINLPRGLTINKTTGVISGTPKAAGRLVVEVTGKLVVDGVSKAKAVKKIVFVVTN